MNALTPSLLHVMICPFVLSILTKYIFCVKKTCVVATTTQLGGSCRTPYRGFYNLKIQPTVLEILLLCSYIEFIPFVGKCFQQEQEFYFYSSKILFAVKSCSPCITASRKFVTLWGSSECARTNREKKLYKQCNWNLNMFYLLLLKLRLLDPVV